MTIPPKYAMWFGIMVTILSAIGQGTLAFPDFIPAGAAHNIASACLWVSTVLGIISTVTHGFSAPQPGPLVSAAAAAKAPTP